MTEESKQHGGYHSPTQTRKGVPNKVNAATRQRIEESGDPVGFLMSIMNGEPIPQLDKNGNIEDRSVATLEQRITAAKELLRKIVPDLKAVEVSGGINGSPIVFQLNTNVAPPNSQPQQLDQQKTHSLGVASDITEVVTSEAAESDD